MAGKTMRAVRYDGYGGGAAALKHVEILIPSPKKDEVLLKVEAASINPVDWKLQKGVLWPVLPPKFPFVPVTDVAGEVIEVGSGVNNFKVGDKVVSKLNSFHVEIPIPSPKKDEVLLKVEAASINPVDWKIQKGVLWPFYRPKFPFVPVTDVAGEVIEVGSGVNNFKAGDKVVSKLNSLGGGLAEHAVASVNLTVSRPPEVSAVQGAGLPIAALTALQALKSVGTKFDSTGKPMNVLITAASGGVGHYAVQLAKLGNLHVTATCGARNIMFVKDLGADEVLDYKTPEGASLKSPSGRIYNSVIHCTTGISWSTFEPNLSSGGKVIVLSPTPGSIASYILKKLTFPKKEQVPLALISKGEDLGFLVDLVKEGKLKTVVDYRYPLSQAEAAWAKSIDGHATGKIIVEM